MTSKNTHPSDLPLDKIAFLRHHPLFREFSSSVIEEFASHMRRRAVSRGTTIFSKGEAGTGLFGVIGGAVKISVLSAEGKELVINIIQPGEIFGEIALLDGGPRTANATAVSDCQLFVLERRDFIPLLQRQPDIAVKFIEILCRRLRRTSGQLEDAIFLDLPSRLAKTLLQLGHAAGKPDAARRLAITQRDIGQMIGVSRESINKQLRDWAERGWIRLERGAITILKPNLLAEVIKQDSESDLL
jgi:CRP-like cAMP-binding protein